MGYTYLNRLSDKVFDSLELVKLVLGEDIIPAGWHHSSNLEIYQVSTRPDSQGRELTHEGPKWADAIPFSNSKHGCVNVYITKISLGIPFCRGN